MITKGAKVLVIAAIDGTTLSDALQKAADKGIKVIAYDRLIKGSKNVDYYATFDNFQVGVLQAQLDRRQARLKEGKGPFNIELFGGSPDDNNAFFFYDGAMSVLKPYIDSGKLVVRSKQMGMDKVAHAALGRRRRPGPHGQPAERLLHQRKVDAVLSPYDGLSIGILRRSRAWATARRSQPMPVVTGQDAEVPSVKSMLPASRPRPSSRTRANWRRSPSAWSTRCCSGKKPEINDTKTYNNGVKVVPSYLLKPVSVDASNWKQRAGRQRLLQGKRDPLTHRLRESRLKALSRTSKANQVLDDCILEMRGITKTFPGVNALDNVNLRVRAGEIHAVVARTAPANRR